VPVLAMITAPAADIRARAKRLREALVAAGHPCDVVASEGSVGGGAFPTARIASWSVALAGVANVLEMRLREADRPVIGRVADGRLRLDLRSVPAAHDAAFTSAVLGALAGA